MIKDWKKISEKIEFKSFEIHSSRFNYINYCVKKLHVKEEYLTEDLVNYYRSKKKNVPWVELSKQHLYFMP